MDRHADEARLVRRHDRNIISITARSKGLRHSRTGHSSILRGTRRREIEMMVAEADQRLEDDGEERERQAGSLQRVAPMAMRA